MTISLFVVAIALLIVRPWRHWLSKRFWFMAVGSALVLSGLLSPDRDLLLAVGSLTVLYGYLQALVACRRDFS